MLTGAVIFPPLLLIAASFLGNLPAYDDCTAACVETINAKVAVNDNSIRRIKVLIYFFLFGETENPPPFIVLVANKLPLIIRSAVRVILPEYLKKAEKNRLGNAPHYLSPSLLC